MHLGETKSYFILFDALEWFISYRDSYRVVWVKHNHKIDGNLTFPLRYYNHT